MCIRDRGIWYLTSPVIWEVVLGSCRLCVGLACKLLHGVVKEEYMESASQQAIREWTWSFGFLAEPPAGEHLHFILFISVMRKVCS